jgi:glycosyltransferase involved in cell wall biosynthesis
MILVFEPVWTGTYHAPGNSVTIQAIARAFPDQQILVMAEATHLVELMADTAFAALPNIEVRPVELSAHYRYRPQIVSYRRGLRELATLAAALRAAPRGEPVLLVLISATSTAIFAAAFLARFSRRKLGVIVGLHGNLNDAMGWRSHNPIGRALDLRAALDHAHNGAVRFLVLEPSIARAMAERWPAAAARTDVLPLPVNQAEIVLDRPAPFQAPLRLGLVGQATEAKGITAFLDLARGFRTTAPGRLAFHLVGKIPEGDDPARYAPLEEAVQSTPLSRSEFQRRLSRLHFVCLPMQSGYYDLSASGALIDAITWLRPIIATPVPAVRDLFEEFGDIGYLCPDVEAMHAVLARLAHDMDAERHAAQVEQLRRVRDSRTPEALAARFREIVGAGFPALFI